MRYSHRIISGKQCHLFIRGEAGPVIFWGIAAGSGAMARKTARLLADAVGEDFLLAAYETEDWNREFSPWPARGVREGENFAGGGRDTLSWLAKACIPRVEAEYGAASGGRFVAGYSLAGLFALWAYLESGLFSGAAAMSASLWVPGWMELLEQTKGRPKSPFGTEQFRESGKDSIYLSLGRKEEKTRNPWMAAVGDATRETERMFRKEAAMKHVILEWNPGGHFSDPEGRCARGMAWLIREQTKMGGEQ